MLIVLFFRDSRSRGTISPASTASEDFGHYVKRFRVWLSPLPESYYDDSPLFISGGIHQKEAEDKGGGGGGHLPHFTDFGSFSLFAGSCGREREADGRSWFFSILYFWAPVLGGSSGDATERKVGNNTENPRIEEMKGGSCGRPPAEKMVIHLSAFCLIRLTHSALLGREKKKGAIFNRTQLKKKKKSREIWNPLAVLETSYEDGADGGCWWCYRELAGRGWGRKKKQISQYTTYSGTRLLSFSLPFRNSTQHEGNLQIIPICDRDGGISPDGLSWLLVYNRSQSCKTNRPTMPTTAESLEMSRMVPVVVVVSLPISSHRHPWSVEIDQLSPGSLFSVFGAGGSVTAFQLKNFPEEKGHYYAIQ